MVSGRYAVFLFGGFPVFRFGTAIWFGLRGLGLLGYATLRVHGTRLVCGSSL